MEKSDRRSLQLAVKDINKTLNPRPKLNFIASIENLSKQIVETIASRIGEDENGNPIWTDPKCADLSHETISVYEKLISEQVQEQEPVEVQEQVQEQEPVEVQEQESVDDQETIETEVQKQEPIEVQTETQTPASDVYLAEGEECPGFVQALGPKEGDEACKVCSRIKECIERANAEKSKRASEEVEESKKTSKKTSKKALKKYTRVNSVADCLLTGKAYSVDELAESANKLYVEKEGRNNIKESLWCVKQVINVLSTIGLLRNEGEKVIFSKS